MIRIPGYILPLRVLMLGLLEPCEAFLCSAPYLQPLVYASIHSLSKHVIGY
jgi:hypothetical protein